MNIVAAAALVFLALFMSGCGGGGSSGQTYVFTAAGTQRTDVLFGYFGPRGGEVSETAGHTSLVWAPDFYGPAEQLASITQAKGNGLKVVVMLGLCQTPLAVAESEARFQLQRLHNAGLLDVVVGVSWCDEPNTPRSGDWGAAEALGMNAAMHAAMASFPEIAAPRVRIIYSCKGTYPGASSADDVACDDYDSGCNVFARYYGALRDAAPQARLFLVPSGATNPQGGWHQDPACFVDYANTHPEVDAIVAWIYQSVDDGGHYAGIRDNGNRVAYCEAGKKFTRKETQCL